jgi:hypothetical protein
MTTKVTEQIAYTPDPALSFWPTPTDVADDLVCRALCPGYGFGEAASDVSQVRVLEPSAGEGHLARATRAHLPYAHITAVEPNAQRAATLRALPGVVDEVVQSTLENYLAAVAVQALTGRWTSFDLVLMNPPFTLDGRPEAWAEHILAIYTDPHLLAPGGTLGAVVPRIVLTGKSKLVRAVRELFGPTHSRDPDGTLLCEHGEIEPCERGAFAPVEAGVSTALMCVQKPFDFPCDQGSSETCQSS